MAGDAKKLQPIIIKKIKKAAHGHHGGAWKIAYADFVTAMMAFFLLMWLISMTTQEQKVGLAEYFAPAAVSPSNSGAGGLLMGTALDKSGNKSSSPRDAAMGTSGQDDGARRTSWDRELSRPAANQQSLHSAMVSIRQALQTMPEISELSRNILIEPTKDGLNVSLVDEYGRSMFPEGSVQPHERTRRLLEALAPTLALACEHIGCRLEPPRRTDALGFVGADLAADPAHKGLLVFTATLRNSGQQAVAFPHLILTLDGLSGEMVARKVFTPAEFAPATANLGRGLDGGAEIEIKLYLDASQSNVVGFKIDHAYL